MQLQILLEQTVKYFWSYSILKIGEYNVSRQTPFASAIFYVIFDTSYLYQNLEQSDDIYKNEKYFLKIKEYKILFVADTVDLFYWSEKVKFQ